VERPIPVIWLAPFLLGGVGLAAVRAARRPVGWNWAVGGRPLAQLGLNYGYGYT
jgi:hypothetical protein